MDDDERFDHPTQVEALSRAAARARQIAQPVHDVAVAATRDRLRALGAAAEVDGDELVAMGRIVRTPDGGSIRTFSGGLAHENGWWPSRKRRRNLHWQGMAQRDAIVAAETNVRVLWMQSEPERLEFPRRGEWRRYTGDLQVQFTVGPPEIWEIKRGEDDLADPDYRDTLACVCEIYRRCGTNFRIVYADEIFATRHHRANAELFASRRFARVGPEHLGRLARHAGRTAFNTTYGALAEALDPDFPAGGKAVIQALLVRRRIEIDLTRRVEDDSPVRILPTRGAQG